MQSKKRYTMGGQRGFTLIEVMITVAIIAILAAIATPAYNDQVRKSRRADAKVALEQTAQGLERCYVDNNTFVYGAANAPGCPQSFTTNDGYYTITVAATATTYTLTARPTTKGSQADDSLCNQMILASDGSKTSKDKTGTVNDYCW
jgi:type IV pilus assembly protein PilE